MKNLPHWRELALIIFVLFGVTMLLMGYSLLPVAVVAVIYLIYLLLKELWKKLRAGN
jgi:hypothetical protein